MPDDLSDIAVVLAAGLAFCVLYVAAAWFVAPLIRPVMWVIAHSLYRLTVRGRENVPLAGPVLIVSNHVTFLDWMIFWAVSPRPVTFVIWGGFFRNPVLRFGLSFARHRLVTVKSRGPHAIAEALDLSAKKLAAGEAVVIFAEGGLTRNGQLRPFGRGIEKVVKKSGRDVTIVPTYLDNLWGTLPSYSGKGPFKKWPSEFRRRVTVWFGKPLPGTTLAAAVRAAVVECGADCWLAESDRMPLVHQTFVREAARWRNLRRTAFVDMATGSERKLSWPSALVGAWCLSRWLRKELGADPVVGVWLPTGTGSTLTNVALSFLGKASVNLNYTAGPDPVTSAVAQAEIRTVLTAKRFLAKVPLDVPAGVRVVHLEDALAGISKLAKAVAFAAVLLLPKWLLVRLTGAHRAKPDDVLTVLFSSGSTGEPKGVMLSYRNVTTNAEGFRRGVDFSRRDTMLATLPFFHTFGYTVCLWAPLTVGMKAVYFPDPRQAKEVGDLCRTHRCTIMLGTATFLRFYLRRCGPDDFASLRLLICGAEKLPVKLAEEFRAKFGVLPFEGYGCTELSPVVSTNLPDAVSGGATFRANTPGTVGQPIPGVCPRAFDPDTKQPLPPATEGLLGVKGPNVMLGYWKQPAKTAEAIRDGWYISGDVGLVQEDGFIRITGRVSRFAKIAGEMVPLERLDDELHDVLGKHDDRVLVVAAVPDDKRGERVVVLHLAGLEAELPGAFAKLRDRGLPNLWIPDVRDCHAVESFPVLGSGKLDVRAVGDLAKTVARSA
jgi:acyl-[acyl-carrier-protein]-phospholipid O-acyltransferase/long-chain-fatty-acid--[acyl-carrier-protein] ligase